MSDRPGLIAIVDDTGAVTGYASTIRDAGALVVNGVALLSGSPGGGGTNALSYKGASDPTAVEFNYLAGVTSAIQTQLNAKAPLASPGLTGTPTVNGVAFGTAAFKNTGTASGDVPLLGAGGKLASSVLPAIAITDTFVVASQAAMLALSSAETGDVAVRTDLNKSFILAGTDPATLSHWQELLTPTDAVTSVNGQTGVVVLTTQHVAEHSSNLYFTNARADARIAAAVGVTVQAWDADLDALAALPATAGLLSRTGTGAFAARTLTAPAAGLTVTNPTGSGGNPTFGLANDLAALEGLGGTGIAVRIAADTWAQRSIAAGAGISITNGDGVSGNPTVANTGVLSITGTANQVNASGSTGAVTLSLPQNIHTGASPTFTGLTLTGNLSAAGVASSLIPSVTDTYDLGSSTKLWRKGWLSELDAVLFAKNTVTLIGGWLMATKNEGAVPTGADVGAADTSIDFGQAMTASDFVIFRAAGAVEYVQVGSLVSGTRYNVTRNLDGSGANAWPAGSVYAVLGNTGNGRIEINANDTPRISLIRQGATYNAQTELLRVGDLNGGWNYGAETYGFAVGEYAAGKAWLSVDPTNGIRIGLHSVINGQWDTSGNLALGQVATDSGNAFWNNSNKRFEFRGGASGTQVQAYIDTTGAIVGGGGSVVMDASGLRVLAAAAESPASSFSVYNGTDQVFRVGASVDATDINAFVGSTNTGYGRNNSLNITSYAFSASKTAQLTLEVATTSYGGGAIGLRTPTSGGAYAYINVRTLIGTTGPPATGYTLEVNGATQCTGAVNCTGNFTVDTDTLFVDATSNRIGIGTTSPGSNKLHVAGGTLTDQTRALFVSATMPGTGSTGFNTLAMMQATSVNTNQNVYTFNMELLAGGTSAVFYAAGRYYNGVAGTGVGLLDGSSLQGNAGVFGHAGGTTAGHNAGVFGLANNSSALNFGGLFATLSNAGAALACTNYTTTADIFRAYDNSTVVFTIKDGGTLRFHSYGAGTLTTDASGNVTASSDEKLKTKVADFTEGLDAVLQIEPVSYRWKHEQREGVDYVYHGYTAQNVRKALPGAVGKNPDGSLTLDRAVISAAHTNAIKELAARVAALEAAVF